MRPTTANLPASTIHEATSGRDIMGEGGGVMGMGANVLN